MTKTFNELLESVHAGDTVTGFLKADLKTIHHQELQKAREEERERIIKAIRADKNENAENGGEWANGYNAGKFIAVTLAYQSELDQPIS